MKPNYLWYFFIILLNQENTIDGSDEPPEEVFCYETNVRRYCYGHKEFIDDKPGFFECVRDLKEKKRSCGAKMKNVCGKVELFFQNGDKVTITGCEKKDKSELELCKEWSKPKQIKEWQTMFDKKYEKHNCSSCEEDYCNSKNPVTTTKTPVTSPSSPKKEEKSENSGVSPNMALLMLLVLLIFSF